MTDPEKNIECEAASKYIRQNFEPTDRLAIVLINRAKSSGIQRLATARTIADPTFQSWLRSHNQNQSEVYVSMNALAGTARGRTKADVDAIRHVYLDFDDNGSAKVQALLNRAEVPKPNFVLNSSPEKWQVVWKVKGFSKTEAEALQRALARQFGGDVAATDCARVLRVPGFYNHKYSTPHLVTAGVYSDAARVFTLPEFPSIRNDLRELHGRGNHRQRAPGDISQSERDWAYAKSALHRGESQQLIIAAIARYRRFSKYNPEGYARRTVEKAREEIETEKRQQHYHADTLKAR
jgi:hypothetical protein